MLAQILEEQCGVVVERAQREANQRPDTLPESGFDAVIAIDDVRPHFE